MALAAVVSAETALGRGDYGQCLAFLEPLAKQYPIESEEGSQIRMLMITAWMGQGEDRKAISICRLLIKSKDPVIRQQAKQLISILEAPDLPRPESWSVKMPTINVNSTKWSNHFNNHKNPSKKISYYHPPTGPTKAFGLGFSIFSLISLILLTIFFSF